MSKIVTFSEAASIALHGIILIARADKNLNVQDIADKLGSSKHHVAKVMQRLVKEDFISSFRGPGGGFSLNKKSRKISFLKIYEAVEGKIKITPCPFEKEICEFDKCILSNITAKMTKDFKKYLSSQNIGMYLT